MIPATLYTSMVRSPEDSVTVFSSPALILSRAFPIGLLLLTASVSPTSGLSVIVTVSGSPPSNAYVTESPSLADDSFSVSSMLSSAARFASACDGALTIDSILAIASSWVPIKS